MCQFTIRCLFLIVIVVLKRASRIGLLVLRRGYLHRVHRLRRHPRRCPRPRRWSPRPNAQQTANPYTRRCFLTYQIVLQRIDEDIVFDNLTELLVVAFAVRVCEPGHERAVIVVVALGVVAAFARVAFALLSTAAGRLTVLRLLSSRRRRST